MQYTYKYTKLPTRSTIRLIQLQPERVNDDIAISIHTYDMQQLQNKGQNISYRALSYRWGDKEATRHVFLRDIGEHEWHRHPVHENLWQFINYAWQKKLFEGKFWTDYFCLDQDSEKEKNEQIPRMGAIYKGAIETVIWLGLSKSQEQHLESYLTWSEHDRSNKNHKDAEKKNIHDTVRGLWKHEYWSRLWIVQEVALAKKRTVLTRFSSMSLHILVWEIFPAKPSSWESREPGLGDLTSMLDTSWSMWLLLLLCVSQPYQCSRLNDRLYGVLGLLRSPPEYIRINYDRPYGYVILDAILESTGDWVYYRIPGILDKFAEEHTPIGLTKNSNELEEYAADPRTLTRHKELALLAQQAFDAMSFAMSCDKYGRFKRLNIHNFYETLDDRHFFFFGKEGFFLGIALAVGSNKDWATNLLEDWKSRRQPKLQTRLWQSPWRCAAHMDFEEDISEKHMKEYAQQLCNTHSIEERMEAYEQEHMRRFGNTLRRRVYMHEYKRIFEQKHKRWSMSDYTYGCLHWYRKQQRRLVVCAHTDEANIETKVGCEAKAFLPAYACGYSSNMRDEPRMTFRLPGASFRMTNQRPMVCTYKDGDIIEMNAGWEPEAFLAACGYSDKGCDESCMTFTMPDAAFRMTVFYGGSMVLEPHWNRRQTHNICKVVLCDSLPLGDGLPARNNPVQRAIFGRRVPDPVI